MRAEIINSMLFIVFVTLLSVSALATDVTDCQEINESGSYYLTADITDYSSETCFDILTSDIIIDCQNHIIDGDSSTSNYAFSTYNRPSVLENITIRNCVITNIENEGISFNEINDSVVENIYFMNNKGNPIFIYNSNNNTVRNITFENNCNAIELYIYNSTYIQAEDINITSHCENLNNIRIEKTEYVSINGLNINSSNPITENLNSVLVWNSNHTHIDCENGILDGNNAHEYSYGIYSLGTSDDGEVYSHYTTVRNCYFTGWIEGVAVYQDSLVENNTFYDNERGGVSLRGDGITVRNNIFIDNGWRASGFSMIVGGTPNLFNSTYSNIYNNQFYSQNESVSLIVMAQNVTGTEIHNNIFTGGSSSIQLNGQTSGVGTQGGLIYNNTMSGSGTCVYFRDNSNLNITDFQIYENTMYNCSYAFARYQDGTGKTVNNYIWDNLINVSNYYVTSAVTFPPPPPETPYTNYWNTTESVGINILGLSGIGGNYWGIMNGTGYSDTCDNLDSDAYCDDPFAPDGTIFPLQYDYLPLTYYSEECIEDWSLYSTENTCYNETTIMTNYTYYDSNECDQIWLSNQTYSNCESGYICSDGSCELISVEKESKDYTGLIVTISLIAFVLFMTKGISKDSITKNIGNFEYVVIAMLVITIIFILMSIGLGLL